MAFARKGKEEMTDYIRREDAISVISGIDSSFVKYIEQLPSADVRENGKGHWRKMLMACYGGETITEYECSECNEHQLTPSNFCPNCGADMRKGDA